MYTLKNNLILFGLICVVNILISYIGEKLLITPELFYNQFNEQITFEKAIELYSLGRKYSIIGLLLIPILYALKFLIIATIIQVGIQITQINLEYSSCFRIAILSEFVFVSEALTKIVWFVVFKPSYSITDLSEFSPLSVFSLFKNANFEPWLNYGLRTLNLFEFAYIILMSFIVSKKIDKSFDYSINFILKYYGIALLIWTIFASFFLML